jgi:hypothetical protein
MTINSELLRIIDNNFSVGINSSQLDSESEFLKHLQLKLAERIKFFIRTDMDKLLQALYRIDIDDALSTKAFDQGEIGLVSSELAHLIITRQLQKLEYSRKFDKE